MNAISLKFYPLQKHPDATERIAAMRKDARKAVRGPIGSKVWIRFDDGFSVRECRLMDLSSEGIRLLVGAPYDVAGLFSLMMTRDSAPGQRCRVKWRRGQEIGAEFVGANAGQRAG